MEGLISVIIPVYNVDKYIRECFDCLLNQTYQNFEVLIVDDGSTDESGKICDYYALKDSRFIVEHTENQGIGKTRNLAMKKMQGEYCYFLDPDDVIESDVFEYLVELINKTDSDMALGVTRQFCGPYQTVKDEIPVETVFEGHKDIVEKVMFDKNDLKPLERKTEPSNVTYEFFSTMYRVNNLNKNRIRFLPISYGEDTFVVLKSLATSNRVVTTTKITYSHRRNPTSTTFQYHPEYLKETHEYYDYYLSIFKEYAPEYLEQATIALDGQYFRRCIVAIERELFMSPKSTTANDMIRVIQGIREDVKFKKLFSNKNMKYTPKGKVRIILRLIKLGYYQSVINLFVKYYRK